MYSAFFPGLCALEKRGTGFKENSPFVPHSSQGFAPSKNAEPGPDARQFKMNNNHVISDQLFKEAVAEMENGNHWIAYNTQTYFLDNADMWFFPNKKQAVEFARDNWSDRDAFAVLHADSLPSFLHQFPYGKNTPIDFLTIKNTLMNEKNLDFLKSNIRNHGFGETLGPELEAQIKKGVTEFSLPYKTEVNKNEMEATLHFSKSDKSDLYFFNRYDSRVKNERDETMSQTFYINNGWGVTLKEAYNLLNGRAVHKELTNKEQEKYQAWIQLDFSSKDKHGNYERKQYHQNYGYDLKEAVSFYPIKEMMKEIEAKDLLRSLERGNLQMVTVTTPEKDIRVFIEANPQYKSLNVYDNKMNRLDQDQRQELMRKPELPTGQEQNTNKEKSTKQTQATEERGEKKSKAKKEKVPAKDNGLITKKRTRSSGKGMGV